jgi:hypothetical protein
MKTPKNVTVPNLTPEQLAAVLASVSVDTLTATIKDKRLNALQPLIDKYEATMEEAAKLKKEIQTLNPEWKPATLPEKMHTWVLGKTAEGKTVTAEEIRAHFKADYYYGPISAALKNLIEKKQLIQDKDGKITAEEAE